MFPNVLAPSPIYQGVFRAGQLTSHPALAPPHPHPALPHSSASFMVDNLLRERTSSLLHRPTPTAAALSPLGVAAAASLPGLSRGSPVSPEPATTTTTPTSSPATSSGTTAATTKTTPYLKFGVSAILGTDKEQTSSSSSSHKPSSSAVISSSSLAIAAAAAAAAAAAVGGGSASGAGGGAGAGGGGGGVFVSMAHHHPPQPPHHHHHHHHHPHPPPPPSLAGPLPKACHVGPTAGLNCVGCTPRHASVFDTPFPALLRPPYFGGSPLLPMPNPFTFLSTMRGKPRRGMLRRAVFSDAQRKGLEKMFQRQKYISKPDRKKLASKLGLKDSQARC
ncbi:uncharacterized protein LOC143301456 isoform X2 [Babylonia areolata]|uniref:uncharacterized protein LOC143301456 isoform X2 n=1 Tax=Babylonia areolata TaxID=304850 RepID=UPI003FD19D3A